MSQDPGQKQPMIRRQVWYIAAALVVIVILVLLVI